MKRAYRMTDDPADPCSLCVHWEEQPDDFMAEHAIPWRRPGVRADRIYMFTHESCEQSAIQYTSEAHL